MTFQTAAFFGGPRAGTTQALRLDGDGHLPDVVRLIGKRLVDPSVVSNAKEQPNETLEVETVEYTYDLGEDGYYFRDERLIGAEA